MAATARFYCTGNGQAGNVYHAALTQHDDWSEQTLTWNNQPDALPPVAYVVPEAGRWVEFSVLPQVREALATDRRVGLQLWAPYDLGDAGVASFASKEDPDTNRHPQLVLQFSNMAPAMTLLTNMSMNANSTLGPLTLAVSDAETRVASLLLTGRSSTPALLPDQNISISALGGNRYLSLTPLPSRSGVTEITLQLSDGAQTVAQKFLLRVGPATNPPVLSLITNQTLIEDSISARIPFTVSDSYGRARDLPVTFTVTTLFREPPIRVTQGSLDDPAGPPGNVSQRFFVLTPAANYSGSNRVDVRVSDGFLSATQTFLITILRVDDPPGPITLDAPAPGTIYLPGQPVTLVARIRDSERDLGRVEFRHDGVLLGTIFSAPYQWMWTNPPAGLQRLTAVAQDLAGQRTESVSVYFQFGDEPEAPAFLALRREGDFITVSWDTDGRQMRLQFSDLLGPGADWRDVEAGLGTGAGNAVTLPATNAAARFFRLKE